MSRIDTQSGDGTALARASEQSLTVAVNRVHDSGEFAMILDSDRFEHLQRVAKLFAASELIPQHYRGKFADVFIALQMAMRQGIDPLAFMQGTYVIQGKLGMEAKLAIALINTGNIFKGHLRYELNGEGDDRGCTVKATTKDGEEVAGPRVTIKTAKDEGWFGRNGSKWRTIPDLMLQYRAASWFGRLYCPERLMGMQTIEEIRDVGEIVLEPTMADANRRDAELKERLADITQSAARDSQSTQPGHAGAASSPALGAAAGDGKRHRRTKAEMGASRINDGQAEPTDQSNPHASDGAGSAPESPAKADSGDPAAETTVDQSTSQENPDRVNDWLSRPWTEVKDAMFMAAKKVKQELTRAVFEKFLHRAVLAICKVGKEDSIDWATKRSFYDRMMAGTFPFEDKQ
jgi:hypothetical protein